MKITKKDYKFLFVLCAVILVISALALLTHYKGTSDLNDYAGVAKFFAGDSVAKLRASHSILYGFASSPLLMLLNSFILMKLESLLWLILLTASIYYISNKNKKTLLLFISAPIVWYMAPWVTPAFLISLLMLWSYYFIQKFEETEKIRHAIYSGILIGLSAAIWGTMLYISVFMLLAYFYNKRFFHSWIFIASILLGLLPTLILDQFIFNFAFYSIAKHFSSCFAFMLYGGIYGQGMDSGMIRIFLVLIFVPFYSWLLFKKSNFIQYKKPSIFLAVSLLFMLFNPQIRLVVVFVPVILLILGELLKEKQFKIQLAIFLILTLLVINPYVIQIKYSLDTPEFGSLARSFPNLHLNSTFTDDVFASDLAKIAEDYPNQIFVVGNKPDDYQKLAFAYWGKEINELISIQDYQLYLTDETIIAGKTFCSYSMVDGRRDICITIDLRKAINDNTDYSSIEYAISLDNNLSLENFAFEKKYELLSVYKKE